MPSFPWAAIHSTLSHPSLAHNEWQTFQLSNQELHVEQETSLSYLLVFGVPIEAIEFDMLHALFVQAGVKVLKAAIFQPTEALLPAVVFAFNGDTAEVKAHLEVFKPQMNAQLVVVENPPCIQEAGLLVMDMDSTAIEIECIDEIARLAGVYDEVSAVTAQAMQGALEFSESLRMRVAKLKGIEQSLIDELKLQLPLMPGVKELCQYLQQHNWKLAIASGGFIPFAEQVQGLLNLDAIHANELEFEQQRLTGKVLGVIVDAQEKSRFLQHYAGTLGINIEQTVAMGDGANDLVMMATAGLGVAVHGKPLVAKTADVAINTGSLLQVAYFLSFPRLID